MEMTSTEINVKIATAIGYTNEGEVWTKPPDRYKTVMKGPRDRIIPNFCKDQGAIIDLCHDLKKNEQQAFITELGKFAKDQSPAGKSWHNCNASARERSLAWLYTKKVLIKEAPLAEVV